MSDISKESFEPFWNKDAGLLARIADLEKQLAVMTLKANASLANNLCPDHRDKQTGKPCLACEVEKLEKQLAEKDKEIERMRPVVEAVMEKGFTLHGWLDRVQKAMDKYEQSTKPDGGTEI